MSQSSLDTTLSIFIVQPNKKTKSGKKVKYNEDDFIQKSLGYDMEDEFIDDSEAVSISLIVF